MSPNNQESIVCCQTTATLEQFWKAVNIWNTSPHVVNRRLCGSVSLFTGHILHPEVNIDMLISEIRDANVSAQTSALDDHVIQILKEAGVETQNNNSNCEIGIGVYIKKLLPRNSDKFHSCNELVIIDRWKNEALFMGLEKEHNGPLLTPCFPYSFCYKEEKKEIHLLFKDEIDLANPSVKWLKETLFPKIIKWAETAKVEDESNGLVTSSLNLVNITKYNTLYQKLKKKYGIEMVKIWPENTDPLKFVYEDVAIATYLLVLWEEERLEKGTPDVYQTFVDVGCGNGLLVHILNSEGHQGVGLDIRKRYIWDMYPSSTKLQVQAVTPSADCLFPQTDWIIGNHSDELTPWIPVIAARSSYKCRFFLLPCCCFEFSGQKYQRIDSSQSQYVDYLHYISRVCRTCGFETKFDKLRIPSTKRICLIGSERNYPEEDVIKVDKSIQELIESKTNIRKETANTNRAENHNGVKEQWSQDFKLRESIEKVCNCTQIDRGLIEEIVALVAKELLNKRRLVQISNDNKDHLWNAGGTLLLRTLATLIPRDKLKGLKNECGGLQTLLKNNGHIFKIERGYVQFKMPLIQVSKQTKKPHRKQRHKGNVNGIIRKQKPCWFYFNHPDGCPLSDKNCSYSHSTQTAIL